MCIYTKQIMFPKELNSAVDFLNTLTIQIAEGHEDGRVNSIAAFDEKLSAAFLNADDLIFTG